MSWIVVEVLSKVLMLIFLNPISPEWFVRRGLKLHLKLFFLVLIIFYTSFSLKLTVETLKFFKLRTNVEALLTLVENVLPILISFFISLNFIRDKQLRVIMKFCEKPQLSLNKVFHQHSLIVLKFCVIFLSKFMQMFMVNDADSEMTLIIGLSFMFPEFILKAVSMSFVFHVNCCTIELTRLRRSIQSDNAEFLENEKFFKVELELEKQMKMSKKIEKFYSGRLLQIIIYEIFQVIVSLYWIFIRIVYNHLNLATFAYLIPPTLSLYSIFNSSQKFGNAKKKLIVELLKLNKTHETIAYRFVEFLRFQHYNDSRIVVMGMIPLNFATCRMVSDMK